MKNLSVPYLFPPEGNFDIDAGDGGGGGPFRTQKISNYLKNIEKIVRTKIVQFWDIFKKSKKKLKLSSYIRKMTQNPIDALKITNYNTQFPNKTRIRIFQKDKFKIISVL